MASNLEIELQRIGLDERQAKVYLAALELGPSPVQKIAQRSGIPRATVYLILDDLQEHGFVATYEEGKKTLFVAESPDRLEKLLDQREKELKRERRALQSIIPELVSRAQLEKGDHKTSVKFYEGIESMKASLRDDLNEPGQEVLNFFVRDKAQEILAKMDIDLTAIAQRRKRKKVKRRIIYTSTDNQPYDKYPREEAIFVPFEEFPLKADVTVIGNRVAISPYDEPIRGIAIQDEAIADSLRCIFNLVWSQHRQ